MISWWNKQNSLKKIVYTYLTILLLFWIIYGTFQSLGLYFVGSGDLCGFQQKCSLGYSLFLGYIFIPAFAIVTPLFFIFGESYGIFLMIFDFAPRDVLTLVGILYFWSMPLIFGLHFKNKGRKKLGYALIGIFMLIPIYIILNTILFTSNSPYYYLCARNIVCKHSLAEGAKNLALMYP